MKKDDCPQKTDEFYIAVVRKAHGVRGAFRIALLSGEAERFHRIEHFTLVNPKNEKDRLPMRIRHEVSRIDSLILSAEPWTTPEEAQAHRGWYVAVPRAYGCKLGENEFYTADLIGLQAYTIDGELLGGVEQVLTERAQPLFHICRRGSKDLWLPAVAEFVSAVDLDEGRLILDPPPGLIEIYRSGESR